MSVYVMSSVWKLSQHDASDLLVLLAIADYADDDGAAWPSIEALMRKSRLSERAVRYSIRRLATAGELLVSEDAGPVLPPKQGRKRGSKATLYTVTLGLEKSCKVCATSDEVAQIAPRSPANGDESPTPPIKDGTTSTDPPEDVHKELATPERIVALWNATMTAPIPQTRLTSGIRAKLALRCKEFPKLATWTALFQWAERQEWGRASGKGDYPTWTFTLGYFIKSDTKLAESVERVRAEYRGQRTRANIQTQTRAANAAAVAALPINLSQE